MWFSIFILSCIFISTRKLFFSLSLFQKIFKISVIFGTTFMQVIAFTILPILSPLAFVIISLWRFPDAMAILFTIFPITLKLLAIHPHKFTHSVSLSLQKLASINSISIFFTSIYS